MRFNLTLSEICCETMQKALREGVYTPIVSTPSGSPISLFDVRMGKAVKRCPYCEEEATFPYGNSEVEIGEVALKAPVAAETEGD